jgi:PAS domain-containing protein
MSTELGNHFSEDESAGDETRVQHRSKSSGSKVGDPPPLDQQGARSPEDMAWLARIPEQNPDPVIRLTKDGRVLYMNPSAQAVFPGELRVGETASEEWLRAITEAAASGAVQES